MFLDFDRPHRTLIGAYTFFSKLAVCFKEDRMIGCESSEPRRISRAWLKPSWIFRLRTQFFNIYWIHGRISCLQAKLGRRCQAAISWPAVEKVAAVWSPRNPPRSISEHYKGILERQLTLRSPSSSSYQPWRYMVCADGGKIPSRACSINWLRWSPKEPFLAVFPERISKIWVYKGTESFFCDPFSVFLHH